MSGLNLFKVPLVIIEPPVSGLLMVRLIPTRGRIVPSEMVKVIISISPPLVSSRRFVFSSSGDLPSFVFQMVQIVASLLLMSPGRIKCSDGCVRLPAEFLYEISGDQVSRPVQTVGAVDTYQTSLGLGFQDRRVEFLHIGLTGDGEAYHRDFDMTPAKLLTVLRSVVAVRVGEVHDMFQLRSRFLQLL